MTLPIFLPPRLQATDANGAPLAGAKLYFYTAGTTTPITTYQDAGQATPATNPLVADSTGTFAATYIADPLIKYVLKNASGATVQTVDNIPTVTFDALFAAGADIASASTINLTTATGPLLNLTGSTTVNTVILANKAVRIVRATGAIPLTASSTLIVNGSSSVGYTATAEDLLLFEGYASSVVRVWVIGPPKRQTLTAARTYYFRSDGSDSNNGLTNSAGGAFLTANKAFQVITATLDLAGQTVTVQRGNAVAMTAQVAITPWIGGGALVFDGNSQTLTVASADAITASGTLPGNVTIQNVTIGTTTSGVGITNAAIGGGILVGSGVTFAACATAHMNVSGNGAYIAVASNYSITGAAPYHYLASKSGFCQIDFKTVTITGTPAFSSAFAAVFQGGQIEAIGVTFTGSATGYRFSANSGGIISTNGAGASYFPGNTAGVGTNFGTSPYGLYQ